MKITLVMVQSLDGKITMWDPPHKHGWASKEDHAHFHTLLEQYSVLVMGRNTYEAVKTEIRLTPNLLRIVFTHHPEKYGNDSVAGQLEFTKENPLALVKRLEFLGHTDMLLVGGSNINSAFLSEKLICDCIIAIEPTFFGSGKNLFEQSRLDISLQLINVQQLNSQGTMVLKYTVIYDRHTR